MKKRRYKFKAFRGKDAYKYYIFKNDARRKSFRSIDTILKIIYRLAFLAFFISMAGIAAGFAIWIMSYVLIIGFATKIEDNAGYKMMKFCFQVIPIVVIIYVVVYLLKFIVEWLYILNESRELNKKKEENKNYIVLAGAIKKVKVMGLVTLLIAGGVLYTMSLILGSNTFEGWHVVLIGVLLLAFIVNKIFSTRTFLKIQPEIAAIEQERADLKQEKKEQKSKPSYVGEK